MMTLRPCKETTMRYPSLLLAAFVAAGIGAASPAIAAPRDTSLEIRTAGDLADLCAAPRTDPTGPERQNYCHGFAQGALVMELKRETAIGKKRICFPNPTPTREVTMSEFVKWTRAIPKNQALPATDGLFTFLSERFPCK